MMMMYKLHGIGCLKIIAPPARRSKRPEEVKRTIFFAGHINLDQLTGRTLPFLPQG